ncbi:MAG: hypothetical protein D6705_01165 [Deltaproteobacteria bacterium]|nr:MAG: hypothetical protein D6705_01165 [Deltaproteobacteria bacterium]
MTPAYLVSPRYDALWFVGPALLALVWGIFLGVATPTPAPVRTGLWLVAVVLVDVAHVYATVFRTYADAEARRLHGRRLVLIPVVCLWVGFLVHLASPLWFWRLWAYVAVFHFIQQHVGFALLYARKGGEPATERPWIRLAVWAGTAAPVVVWHATLPREIAWFVDGDFFVGLPPVAGTVAMLLAAAILGAWIVHRVRLHLRGRANPMTDAMVLLPAATWFVGIVAFDDDRIFTVTNVLLHGIPYMALVFVTGGRRLVTRRLPRLAATPVAAAAIFYVLLSTWALVEEGLWDLFVHHDRPELFGTGVAIADPSVVALAAALLSVPQTTHYLLDRWIWRAGPLNPHLASDLGFAPRSTPPP